MFLNVKKLHVTLCQTTPFECHVLLDPILNFTYATFWSDKKKNEFIFFNLDLILISYFNVEINTFYMFKNETIFFYYLKIAKGIFS